jgi:hypothetical protein
MHVGEEEALKGGSEERGEQLERTSEGEGRLLVSGCRRFGCMLVDRKRTAVPHSGSESEVEAVIVFSRMGRTNDHCSI